MNATIPYVDINVNGKAQHDFHAELKWLHEFDIRNRFEGDTLNVLFKFY